MLYYGIIIGLFVIFYAVFIYSLCKISKEADIRADKIFTVERRLTIMKIGIITNQAFEKIKSELNDV